MDNLAQEIWTVNEHEKELSEYSYEIDTKNQAKELKDINAKIRATMRKNNIVCLAAPQIGFSRRIFNLNFADTEIKTFVNPVYKSVSPELILSKETSPVEPGKTYLRLRNAEVELFYQRPMGQIESRKFVGMASALVQQGMDALNGVLNMDVGLEIDDDWDKLTEEEQEEIIKLYLDSLDVRLNNIKKEIEQNDIDKKTMDAIDFIDSVNKGETVLKPLEEV